MLEKPLVDKEYVMEKFHGKGGWTFVRIPEVLQRKDTPFGWVKVRGSIDNFEFKSYRLQPMGNGQLFLPIKSEIRKKINKQEGDKVHVIIYEDHSPLEIPDELLICLKDEPMAYDFFIKCTEGIQKEFITWIYSAKTANTKADRILKTIEMLIKRETLRDKYKKVL